MLEEPVMGVGTQI